MDSSKVLLIGWDAADWKVIHPLIEAGRMPNIKRLIDDGASGRISTLHPPLSPMLWTSIATGKRPFKHGIHGFAEPTPDGRGVRPVTNLSRTAKALWNIFHQNDLNSIVIGWWPSHPAEPIRGVMVSDHFHRAHAPLEQGWPLTSNAVHPPELAATIAALRMHPEQLTVEMVERFVPLAKEIDQEHDQRFSLFLRTLAECISIQAAAMWLVENRPWDFFGVYFDAIDHFSHGFMRFHPPQQPWIAAYEFGLYQHVISMAYQFHDEMLGALLAKAGEETYVILMSDHGFHPDHLRPSAIPEIPAGPAIEHREFGILAMQGPLIRKTVLRGASVLDVAPTILAMYGLPIGVDMDGKVLIDAFAEPRKIERIASWENVAGEDGSHPKHTHLDAVAAREALDQMVALGYIERPDANREMAVEKTIRELRYNLGESYQDAGRHAEAHEIFLKLHAADHTEQRFAVKLFVSAQALGMIDEMRRIVEELEASGSERVQRAVIDYLKAQVWIAEKRYADALAAMERVGEANLLRPDVLLETGDLYAKLRRLREAQQVYEKALLLDPDNARAHAGSARTALARRRYRDAAAAALEAIERFHQNPEAHFLLGRALAGMKEYARAAEAFRAAISFNPNFPEAHAKLADLLEKHLSDPESAREHRRLAREMKNRYLARNVKTRRTGRDSTDRHAVAGRNKTSSTPEAFEMRAEHDRDRTARGPDGAGQEAPRDSKNDSKIVLFSESVIVVTGLPRSGTSMLMQMLAAGGLEIMADGLREPDEDNPRGYFEFEPVRNLLNDSTWLFEARGKAIKIVLPLLVALPPGLPCRVILCERDLDEVLDSQDRMLVRRNQTPAAAERRGVLKEEYARASARTKAMLARRERTALLTIEHAAAIRNPIEAARAVSAFLDDGVDAAKMAGSIDPALHRNRTQQFASRR